MRPGLRRRRSLPLFVPLIELLCLLLLLLWRALLHRRSRTYQRMRLLRSRLLRLAELAILRLLRTIRLGLRHPVLRLRHIAVFFRRSSLLLIYPRLRPEHRLHPIIFR